MVSKAGKTTEILDSNVMKKKHVRPVSFSERKFASVMDKISKSNISAFQSVYLCKLRRDDLSCWKVTMVKIN